MGPAAKSYMKKSIEGRTTTTISGDTKADWSDAFTLVSTLDVAYIGHATSHLVEVAVGLDRIGFQVRQQIIWNKTAAAMSRQACTSPAGTPLDAARPHIGWAAATKHDLGRRISQDDHGRIN